MRRTASEVLRNLEIRVARLEKQSAAGQLVDQSRHFLPSESPLIGWSGGKEKSRVLEEVIREAHRQLRKEYRSNVKLELADTLEGGFMGEEDTDESFYIYRNGRNGKFFAIITLDDRGNYELYDVYDNLRQVKSDWLGLTGLDPML